MQNPVVYDITCYQGANYDETFIWSTGGTPVNLTGYSARMQVRETFDSTSTIVSLTSGTGITLGGTAGSIAIALTATQTAAIDATPNKQYIYDVELVSSVNYVTRILQGNFIVNPEVTR